MRKSKKERLAELAAKQVDDGQVMIEGVKPVSLAERLTWMGSQPLQPARKQKPLDIGFWNPMRNQMDLF